MSGRLTVVFDDGGRSAAGFAGRAWDCVTRSIAIVAGLPYREVYEALSAGCREQRVTKRTRRRASARSGVNTSRKVCSISRLCVYGYWEVNGHHAT